MEICSLCYIQKDSTENKMKFANVGCNNVVFQVRITM